jgi:hypothetical protein
LLRPRQVPFADTGQAIREILPLQRRLDPGFLGNHSRSRSLRFGVEFLFFQGDGLASADGIAFKHEQAASPNTERGIAAR